MKTKKTISVLLTIMLILSVFGIFGTTPTATAWVDGRARAPWTKPARNYRDNYMHWFMTAWRGVPFLTYMLWDYASQMADEIAYNASRAVTVDDVRWGLWWAYVPTGYMSNASFWSNLTAFEAAFGWQPMGGQSVPPTHTYVEVNDTVFFTDYNLTSTNFNVSVYVQNVTNMWIAGIKLGYNASMLEAVRVYPGAVPASFGGFGAGTWTPVNASGLFNPAGHPVINNTRRYTPDWSPMDSTTYAYVWVGFTGPLGWTFSGTGELFKIEFHIIDDPKTHLTTPPPTNASHYTYLDLWDTEVRDNYADWIDHAPLDGRYTHIMPNPVAGAPIAVCSVIPSTVYVGDSVTFSSAGSDDSGAPPLTYAWDIGSDGSVEYTTPTVSYTPPAAGTYNVTLTVTNALNLTDSTTCYFTVLEKLGPVIDVWTSPGRWSGVDTWDNATGKGKDMPADALTPGLEVTLYAEVTYNGAPEMWALVTFEVIWEWQVDWYNQSAPPVLQNQTILVATNYTDLNGITTTTFRVPTTGEPGDPNDYIGKWLVIAKTKVKEITVQDSMRFDVGYLIMLEDIETYILDWYHHIYFAPSDTFPRGWSMLYVVVSLKSIHWIPRNANLTLTVYSDANELIGTVTSGLTVPGQAYYCSPYDWTWESPWIEIPLWANVGIGRVEVSVLTALPRDSGVAYSPSISATINIEHVA